MGKEYWDNRAKTEPYLWGKAPTLVGRIAKSKLRQRKLKKILDIGSGYGRDSIYLAKGGYDVTAIDISKEMVRQGRQWAKEENLDINFLIGDFLKYNFDESYDTIISFNTFHLFLEHERELAENKIYQILKPDGCLIISNFSIDEPQYGEGEEIEENTFFNKKKEE